jgi:hypothetical protein
MYVLIAKDPIRYRPIMSLAVLEKVVSDAHTQRRAELMTLGT